MTFDPKAHLIQLPRKEKDRLTGQWTTRYDDYLEVRWRVLWFRHDHPHGLIISEEVRVDVDKGYARYRTVVVDSAGGKAIAHGTETAADFPDFAERAETRAFGRALALMGYGTAHVGQDLTEGDHVADAPVAQANGQPPPNDPHGTPGAAEAPGREVASVPNGTPSPGAEEASRLTTDQSRELKRLAQAVFGYPASDTRLRQDLGFAPDEKLTLRHLAAHVTAAQYQALVETYQAALGQQADADVP
jgi:hypothetical protein